MPVQERDKEKGVWGNGINDDQLCMCLVSSWKLIFFQVQYQTHLEEMEAVKAGMPAVVVSHENSDGPTVRDLHMENFNISVGGRDLIVDGCVTLSYGRHYG